MPFCMELTDTVALDTLATDTVDIRMEDMHLVATPTPTLLTTDSEECPRILQARWMNWIYVNVQSDSSDIYLAKALLNQPPWLEPKAIDVRVIV